MRQPGSGEVLRVPRSQLVCLIGLLTAILLVGRRLSRYQISNRSMEPTLMPGDRLLAERLTQWGRGLPRGAIVILQHPRRAELAIVKRVAAAQGESIAADTTLKFVRQPRQDEILVLGDNLALSTDSRTFGPVPVRLVRGRVRYRYWPPERRGWVD
jgi:signal peptidase I